MGNAGEEAEKQSQGMGKEALEYMSQRSQCHRISRILTARISIKVEDKRKSNTQILKKVKHN
jgi:hypothetical protein